MKIGLPKSIFTRVRKSIFFWEFRNSLKVWSEIRRFQPFLGSQKKEASREMNERGIPRFLNFEKFGPAWNLEFLKGRNFQLGLIPESGVIRFFDENL